MAQRLRSDGIAIGEPVRPGTASADDPITPEVAALRDGGYVIAWAGYDPTTGNTEVIAQRYAADGTADGPEKRVNTTSVGNDPAVFGEHGQPTVTSLAAGGYVIGWAGFASGDAYTQCYAADDRPVGGETQINVVGTGGYPLPAVIGLAEGGYALAWQGDNPANGTSDIFARTVSKPVPLAAMTAAVEFVAGTDGDDVIRVRPGGLNPGDQVDGRAGDDTLVLTVPGTLDLSSAHLRSIEMAKGSKGNDTLIGTTGKDRLDGLAGDDILIGDIDGDSTQNGGNDVLDGGADDDVLYGDVRGSLQATGSAIVRGGDDRLDGGGGTDVLHGDTSGDMTAFPGVLDAENSTVQGGADRLSGGTNDDILIGDAGGRFDAGLSSKVIGGNDDLAGDTGNDLLVGDALGDMIGRDTDALAQGGDDALRGGEGRDILIGDTGGSLIGLAEAAAVGGNDKLDGGDGNDVLYGDARINLFADSTDGFVRAGDDMLRGGDGNDTLYGDAGGEARVVEATMYGGNDVLEGGDGRDTLYGDTGGDIVVRLGTSVFHRGDDTLRGGDGNDVLVGDAGGNIRGEDDSSFVVNGNDLLEGGNGNDVLYGDARGTIAVDPAAWFGGEDILLGGAGDDVLYGDAGGAANVGGNDQLDGGTGRDVLWGGKGADLLTGGAGDDRFMFRAGDGGASQSGADVITDFVKGSDRIGLAGGLNVADLSLAASGTDTVVRIAATSEILATVNGVANLDATDFFSA